MTDPEVLARSFELAKNHRTAEIAFALQTNRLSTAACSIQVVPGRAEFTPETYFQATTVRELDLLNADIILPPREVTIQGKTFMAVDFTVSGADEQIFRSRIYEYYSPNPRQVLVFSLTGRPEDWEQDVGVLEGVAETLEVAW